MSVPAELSIFLADEAATRRLGGDLARALKKGDCLALSGDLGAGKSTLARAIIRSIAEDDRLEVPSPTFTLVQAYALRLPIQHFDFYRLSGADELMELGFDEALGEGVALVEWPEIALEALPAERIDLSIVHEGDGRRITLTAPDATLGRLSRTLAIRRFLQREGLGEAERHFMSGDASTRAYETLPQADGNRLILMDWPRQPLGPVLQDGLPYARLAHIATEPLPFLALSRWFVAEGFVAPRVLACDEDQGFLLLDDLGSEGILQDGGPIAERYAAAAACLARLHAGPVPREIALSDGRRYSPPAFDRRAMQIEVSLLTDWHLAWRTGSAPEPARRDAYRAIWDQLIDRLAAVEQHLVIRDFHSPNILWQENETGHRRIGIIDFQDSMIGPSAYDVASLVNDARVDMPVDLQQQLIDTYCRERRQLGAFDRDGFDLSLAIMSAQRACKLAGAWVRLKQRDNKPDYMRHMPRTLRTLAAALAHPALKPLRNWCAEAGMDL